jgi:hypothetical protein
MLYRRRVITRARVAAFGYAYVVLGVIALALDGDHERAAIALFTAAAFAYLWFLASLRSRLIRFDPDGFYASVVVLGGASFLALQAAALAARDVALAAPGAACAAAVVIGPRLRHCALARCRRGLAGSESQAGSPS